MPSTQRAKIKCAALTYTSHVEMERWWVERDDFETALGALPKGYSEGGLRGTAVWCEPSPIRPWTTQQPVCARIARNRYCQFQPMPSGIGHRISQTTRDVCGESERLQASAISEAMSSSGRRLTSLASSPMILPLGDMGGMRSRWSAHGAFKRLRVASATASWPGLSRPSTTSHHFSNDGWMPATSSGMRRRDRSP
jgi:hypothetical protein